MLLITQICSRGPMTQHPNARLTPLDVERHVLEAIMKRVDHSHLQGWRWLMGEWTRIPHFDDKNAKVQERVHATSGANVIDVIYGGRDEQGRPVSPERSKDGHGHIIALEVDGLYQVLYWRHPRFEGGYEEYGGNRRTNALKDLENDIETKAKLCDEAETICRDAETFSRSSDWKPAADKMKRLFQEWKSIFNWDTPKEKELWRRFKTAQDAFFAKRNADRKRREAEREKNKAAKKALISEAQSLSASSDWKATSKKLHDLMERWKKVGHAGRIEDDALWTEFNDARQTFFRRREAHFNELERQWSINRQIKQDIVTEACRIVSDGDFSRDATERMKNLDVRWKRAGHAGRSEDERLWAEFKAAKDLFWTRKRADSERRSRERYQRLNDAINRKQAQISNLWNQISHLESKRAGLRNAEYISNINVWIDEKKAAIRELERDIQDIRDKM